MAGFAKYLTVCQISMNFYQLLYLKTLSKLKTPTLPTIVHPFFDYLK